jgi:hypothetical protein
MDLFFIEIKLMELINASPFEPFVEVLGNKKLKLSKSIQAAYDKAIKDESKLPEWVLTLNGMSGKRYRHFINNLIESIDSPRYLEVGSWKGSTAVSAIYGNKVKSVCIDNWSQFGDVRQEFYNNIERCVTDDIEIDLYESDFREVDYSSIGKYNVYFFDGPHEEQDQYDSLALAIPSLDDTFIFIVDDWNDPRPRTGTENAIKEFGIEVLYSMQIRTSNGVDVVYPEPHVLENSDWHNGYYIAVCKK